MKRALVVLFALLLARPAAAQCGAKHSTCAACHDGAQAAYATAAPWHAEHAFADLCVACHGGDGEAKQVAAAHAGLVAPRGQCAQCHGSQSEALAARWIAPTPAPPSPKPSPHGRPVPNTIAGLLAGALALAGGALVFRRERGRRDAP